MESGKVSVIVPVYNSEEYIERCVKSIISNTFANLEIILVDDGSTDDSLSILKTFEDDRIVILEKENGGVSSARNEAMKIATGEYIAFVDSDDWIHPQYFELLYQAIGEEQIAHCNMSRCSDYDASIVFSIESEENKHTLTGSQALRTSGVKDYVWGKLYRRTILENLRFSENVKMAEDKVFLSEVLDCAEKIVVIDNRLYYYYDRLDSAIHTSGSNMLPAAKAHLEVFNRRKNPIMLENAYLALFAHRYLNMFKADNKSDLHDIEVLLRKCKKLTDKNLSTKKRIVLKTMADFPILYRVYRIATDHTMLEWERNEKRKAAINRKADGEKR